MYKKYFRICPHLPHRLLLPLPCPLHGNISPRAEYSLINSKTISSHHLSIPRAIIEPLSRRNRQVKSLPADQSDPPGKPPTAKNTLTRNPKHRIRAGFIWPIQPIKCISNQRPITSKSEACCLLMRLNNKQAPKLPSSQASEPGPFPSHPPSPPLTPHCSRHSRYLCDMMELKMTAPRCIRRRQSSWGSGMGPGSAHGLGTLQTAVSVGEWVSGQV